MEGLHWDFASCLLSVQLSSATASKAGRELSRSSACGFPSPLFSHLHSGGVFRRQGYRLTTSTGLENCPFQPEAPWGHLGIQESLAIIKWLSCLRAVFDEWASLSPSVDSYHSLPNEVLEPIDLFPSTRPPITRLWSVFLQISISGRHLEFAGQWGLLAAGSNPAQLGRNPKWCYDQHPHGGYIPVTEELLVTTRLPSPHQV